MLIRYPVAAYVLRDDVAATDCARLTEKAGSFVIVVQQSLRFFAELSTTQTRHSSPSPTVYSGDGFIARRNVIKKRH